MMTILIIALMVSGLFFFLVGTIGILRLPDVLSRIHSGSKCDTLAGILCTTALILLVGFKWEALKLILVIVFIWIGNPTGTNVMASGIYKTINKEN